MAGKILEIEHHPGGELILRFNKPALALLPKETRNHLRTARKETLLALRSLLDKAIERAEEAEKPRKTGRTKIDIQ